jgi:hypothetical protein
MKPYPWGKLVEIHEIGEYIIVEYKSNVYRNSQAVHTEHEEKSTWHPYTNAKDTSCSFESLDAALVGAIARKHDGLNTKADVYFMKAVL